MAGFSASIVRMGFELADGRYGLPRRENRPRGDGRSLASRVFDDGLSGASIQVQQKKQVMFCGRKISLRNEAKSFRPQKAETC